MKDFRQARKAFATSRIHSRVTRSPTFGRWGLLWIHVDHSAERARSDWDACKLNPVPLSLAAFGEYKDGTIGRYGLIRELVATGGLDSDRARWRG